MYFLYQRCGRFKLDISFSLGKLSIQILPVDSVAQPGSTCNKKKSKSLFIDERNVKLNQLSTPFYVDFWSLPQGVQETPAYWFKCIQKVQNNKTTQNNIYCWIETTQIKIEENPQGKFYNNIRDLSIRSF